MEVVNRQWKEGGSQKANKPSVHHFSPTLLKGSQAPSSLRCPSPQTNLLSSTMPSRTTFNLTFSAPLWTSTPIAPLWTVKLQTTTTTFSRTSSLTIRITSRASPLWSSTSQQSSFFRQELSGRLLIKMLIPQSVPLLTPSSRHNHRGSKSRQPARRTNP